MKPLAVKTILRNFGVVIAMICLTMAVAAWLIVRQANQLLDQRVDSSTNAMDAFSDARFHIIQVQQYLTDAAATGDRQGLEDAKSHLQQADAALTRAGEFAALTVPDLVSSAATIFHDAERFFVTGEQMVKAYDSGREQGNAIMKAAGGFDDQALALAAATEQASKRLLQARNEAHDALDDTLETALSIILPAAVVVVVAVFWGVFWLSRFLHSVLGGEPAEANALAEQLQRGELSLPSGGDVVAGSVLASLMAMARRWTDFATALRGHAAILTRQSGEMNQQAHALALSVTEQQRESNDIRQALESLQTVSHRVSASANDTAGIVADVGQQTVSNTSAVLAVADHIQQLSTTVQHAAEQIHALDARAADIASIVTTIRSIAEQTNLLALNAAIEAARAGESGRGFAVVADEVRNLAARTSSATTDITVKISEVHQATQKIVESISMAKDSVASGISLTGQATGGMQSITEASQQAEQQMQQIQQAIRDQELAVERIGGSVGEIVKAIQGNAEQAERLSRSAGHLGELSGHIFNDVSFFKLANQSSGSADATLF